MSGSSEEVPTNNKFPPPSPHGDNWPLSPSTPSHNNNLGPLPNSPSHSTVKYRRSENYYLDDQGVVFLANNVLFKLQLSFLAADLDVQDFEFKSLIEAASVRSGALSRKPGMSDEDPVVLPSDVRASQFRDFLLAVLGRIGDSAYNNLITASQNPAFHRWKCIACFTNIGSLAVRFGMDRLDTWVQSQIQQIFRVSMGQLAAEKWDTEVPLRLLNYIHSTRVPHYQRDILHYVQYFLYHSATRVRASPLEPSLAVFVSLFKDQTLPDKNPNLFGFIFVTVLSFGHRSHFWTNCITREERRILFAAHASLTCLRNHAELQVDWLAQPSLVKDICPRPECSRNFDDCWSRSFASCRSLDSHIPLEDIQQIVRLPSYRRSFASLRHSWHCEAQCAKKTMSKIDASMARIFCGMTEQYKLWSRTA